MIDLKKLQESIDNITPEDIARFFPPDTTPKGWLSIEDYLPKCLAIDFLTGTTYRVRLNDGTEGYSTVGDHSVWYYEAKDFGITHWYNE